MTSPVSGFNPISFIQGIVSATTPTADSTGDSASATGSATKYASIRMRAWRSSRDWGRRFRLPLRLKARGPRRSASGDPGGQPVGRGTRNPPLGTSGTRPGSHRITDRG